MSDRSSVLPAPGLAKRSLVCLIVMGAFWTLAELAALAGIGTSRAGMKPWVLTGPFFSAAVGGIFLLHALSSRPARERLSAFAAGVGIAVALRISTGVPAWDALLTGLGIGSVLVLVVAVARARGKEREPLLHVLLPGLVLPAFVFVSTSFLELTALIRPTTYDMFAYHADQSFGQQPAFVMGRLFASWQPLAIAASLIYDHLPLAFAAILAVSSRSQRHRLPDAITAFLTIAIAGYPLYLLFPLVGPVFLFAGYPWDAPLPGSLPLAPIAVDPVWRNCMPSLHTAWALMAFWMSLPLGMMLRLVTGTFLLFTVLATLGLGYHYLVDVVVAVPFTATIYVALHPVIPRNRLRLMLMAATVSLTAGWLALIRFAPRLFIEMPAAQWALALATTVGSVACVWYLRRRHAHPAQEKCSSAADAPAQHTGD